MKEANTNQPEVSQVLFHQFQLLALHQSNNDSVPLSAEDIGDRANYGEQWSRSEDVNGSQVGLAWCGGFLDGEGCVTLARVRRNCGNRTNYRARVNVPQNCLKTLQTFKDRASESCYLFQLSHRESYTRPIYQLNYDGIHVYRLLQKLRPYLVRKGAEADVLFEFYRDGQPTRHFGPKGVPSEIWHLQERCYDALRCLK